MSETMVQRMLSLADQLVREGKRSSASKRRAVSSAYYAAFHAIARVCADELIGGDRSEDIYVRVDRALDHGVLKTAFSAPPLKGLPEFKVIGDGIVRLRSERWKADYLPPQKTVLFTAAQAEELIALARHTVTAVETLSSSQRRTLATSLLFKSRPE